MIPRIYLFRNEMTGLILQRGKHEQMSTLKSSLLINHPIPYS